MKLDKAVAYFNTTAFGHAAQDACARGTFVHQGHVVATGCVSDGCTGDVNDDDYQPELGAQWLSRWFTVMAKRLYRQGLRRHELGRNIVLRLGASMRDYTQQSSRSKRCRDGMYEYSDELDATVLGFIADDDCLVQVICGDGYTMVDNNLTKLKETGIYPTRLLMHTQERWPETMHKVFDIIVKDMSNIRTFAVASDGIKGETDIQLWIQNWARKASLSPDVLVTGLSRIGTPKGKRDDITVVALSVSH